MRVVTKFLNQRTSHLAEHIDNVSQFDSNDVYYFYDVTSDNELSSLFAQKSLPKFIVTDHILKFDHPGLEISKFYGFPIFLENQVNLFKNNSFTDNTNTKHCFNFMINKKQINRYLLIKFVQWFKLKDYDFTWSGNGNTENLSIIINELNTINDPWKTVELKNFLFSPIDHDIKFIPFKDEDIKNLDLYQQHAMKNNGFYGGNKWTWDNVLSDMFNSSAIALISESLSYQRASVFTEKTLYSILGLNFPIWVGGAWQADEFKKIGLDPFDDIIDHSYQYCNTLIERCYRAFSDNIELLTNLEKTSSLRDQCRSRLLKNRDFLLNGGLTKLIDTQLNNLPLDLKECLIPFINTTWHRSNDEFLIGYDAMLQLITKSQ